MLNWNELAGLRVIQRMAEIVNRRWSLGVAFADQGGSLVSGTEADLFSTQRPVCMADSAGAAAATCLVPGCRSCRQKSAVIPNGVQRPRVSQRAPWAIDEGRSGVKVAQGAKTPSYRRSPPGTDRAHGRYLAGRRERRVVVDCRCGTRRAGVLGTDPVG